MNLFRPALIVWLGCPLAFAASSKADVPESRRSEVRQDANGAQSDVHVLTLPGTIEDSSTLQDVPATVTSASLSEMKLDEVRPRLVRKKSLQPEELLDESAVFLQRRLGFWTEADARQLFGEPVRRRVSYGSDHKANGTIDAFDDPSRRYREFELDFDKESGFLRTVFVYPWQMSWDECRRLWGTQVSSTETNKGRTFHSYLNRRLDVLVERGGKVINFGLY